MNKRQNKKLYSLWLSETEEMELLHNLKGEFNNADFLRALQSVGDIVLTALKRGDLEIR